MTPVDSVLAETKAGTLRGTLGPEGIARFFAIPYARAPFGPLRFAAPEPAPGWDGTRDAVEFGPTAPKPDAEHSQSQLDFLDDPSIAGDDCLNLNVWTPDPTALFGFFSWPGSTSSPSWPSSRRVRRPNFCAWLSTVLSKRASQPTPGVRCRLGRCPAARPAVGHRPRRGRFAARSRVTQRAPVSLSCAVGRL